MAKRRTMDELRQVKDSVYRKPPPKKMPRKSGIVMKETDSKDMPTSTIHHNLTPEESPFLENFGNFLETYQKEKTDTATSVKAPWNNKSEEKEFGTHSSTRSRHDKKLPSTDITLDSVYNTTYGATTLDSDFIANPDLDRPKRAMIKVKASDLSDLVNRSFLRGVLTGCLIGCLLGGLIAMAVMI
jgi:hypothetical protein